MSNVLISTRLIDNKAKQTLRPLTEISALNPVRLVRRTHLNLSGLKCYAPPIGLSRWHWLTEIFRVFVLFGLCCRHRVDFLLGIHVYPHCLYVAILNRIFGTPYIVSVIENPRLYKAKRSFAWILKNVTRVCVRGESSRQFLIENYGLGSDQVFVLPDAFEQRKWQVEKEKTYDVIFLGVLEKAKRLDILIRVLNRLSAQRRDFRAAIVGDGSLRSVVEGAMQSELFRHHVDFVGFQENIDPYLSASKVLLLTSDTEGLPVVIVEAMVRGVPCVVPNVGDITDIVEDGVNGCLVEVEAEDQLCQRLNAILDEPDFYSRLVDGTRKKWEAIRHIYTEANVRRVWQDEIFKL